MSEPPRIVSSAERYVRTGVMRSVSLAKIGFTVDAVPQAISIDRFQRTLDRGPLPYHPKGHDHAYNATAVLTRAAAGLAVAAAAALAAPAFAAAEPTTLVPPTLETAVDGNVVTVTLTNRISTRSAVAPQSRSTPPRYRR